MASAYALLFLSAYSRGRPGIAQRVGFAHRLSIIVTEMPLSGISEVVREYKTAKLIPPNGLSAFCAVMIHLFESALKVSGMRQKAKQITISDYDDGISVTKVEFYLI